MKIFYKLLANALVVAAKNNFVWFALVFWIYLETQSVISTSIVGGIFLVANSLSSFWFGSLVDNYKKKSVMLGSGVASLVFFTIGLLIYQNVPSEAFTLITNPILWVFALVLLSGTIAGSIFNIAIPTLIPVMVSENKRDRANGLFGTVMGIAFSITSFASGLGLGYGSMALVLIIAIAFTIMAIVHLITIEIREKGVAHLENESRRVDVKGTVAAIRAVPGLFALIIFTTFNNLLGGVFMALADAYGLSLVSVQVWGTLLGFLSFGFILGGAYISKKGLGKNPLATFFRVSIIMWLVATFFTIQPSIILLSIGFLIWMALVPFIEATEQTIFQKVVPPQRLGRVFGFAHSVEQAASPLTAFLIGPIAQFVFIPFMTTGKGVDLIGSWFGVGPGRGMALVFITAGILGLIVTYIARHTKYYDLLSKRYLSR